ncbi:MAG: hypothetical protein L6Q98_19045 [Anaerolineae bacterium]|nr:hypothetical protein [Anaerolineae bacterium]NUQ05459.1 hypothetical protein [Anaerolineae bacterium]
MSEPTDDANRSERVDRLLDAIEHVKENRAEHARAILRDLIREDVDSEHAWLWMSVAVDSLDQSSICLDNVLRVNPKNSAAASALYRIRIPEMQMTERRARLRLTRDIAFSALWGMILLILLASFATFMSIAASQG